MPLEYIYQAARNAVPLSQLEEYIREGKTVRLDRFIGSMAAFLVRSLLKKGRNILVVCPNHEEAQFLKSDLDQMKAGDFFLFTPTFQKPYDNKQVRDVNAAVKRSETLATILAHGDRLVITSPEALFDKVASPESFSRATIRIEKGDQIPPEELEASLVDQGYRHLSFVNEPGEFALRGGILDIFPFSGENPVRLEFFGDEVDSIREFDADSQRSISWLDHALLVPNGDRLDQAERHNLFEYLPDETLVFLFNPSAVFSSLNERFGKALERFGSLETEQAPPKQLFLNPEEFQFYLKGHPLLLVGGLASDYPSDAVLAVNASPQPDFNASVKLLKKHLQDLSQEGIHTYILTESKGQRDRFEELLGTPGNDNRYSLLVHSLHRGFRLPGQKIAVYTDHQIFHRYHRPDLKAGRSRGGISFKELRDLNLGDFVVHVDYGIGRFAGFKKIRVRDIEQESVMLRYKDDSILYVNVASLHKLQKYSGKDGLVPKLTRLGSGEWARKKAKTRSRLKDIARDLITLYARRKAQKAYAFKPDTNWQIELEAGFEFEETPDQMAAIQAVKKDMETPTPMDRLICGDVGFGKTEVAIRAAFKAVMDGKQVAILVPTTILADQHYQTFSQRMANFPVSVEVISRFRNRAEQKDVLKRTSEGKVDILIGTHRLTSKDVKFKDLGLLIVDEEQRFGVSVKEKLKELRATVDVLTMTATPIPRTLHMSLMGARDLSVINTPPANRQPVYTEIHSFDSQLIRDAIIQETSREGQVFLIHNFVHNISEYTEMIQQLVPNVRVRFAHGQMSGSQLERIITDFYHRKFDVLISTNIVENGIDIANANTIIINRADRFGLSELHQLRGRVGRSNRKAFCYLITPDLQDLSMDARKRLLALEEFTDLGSGFNIAMRDLDIRGAGDVLGAEQSGFINELGFDLYTKILNDAIRELKETEFKGLFDDVETLLDETEATIEFDYPALLPQDYITENVERLNLYRKLAGARSQEEVDDWINELRDRFGPLPDAVQNLVSAARLKLSASGNGIEKVTIRAGRMWLQLLSTKTREGKSYYEDGRFQQLLAILQEKAADRYKIIQKDDTVRLNIDDIPDIEAAVAFMHELIPDETMQPSEAGLQPSHVE